MNEYTASNGLRVARHEKQYLGFAIYDGDKNTLANSYSHLNSGEMEALREFFRAEEDERLGRWRWHENPDYVVYQRDDGQAMVFIEPTGQTVYRYRGEADELRRMRARDGEEIMAATRAAEAYFDAHPEPKPWHNAKEGEVWIITYGGTEYPAIFQADRFRDHGGSWTLESIPAARRIYPEAS